MLSQKQHWPAVRAARQALAALHPGLFDLDQPVPLAIGIYQQIHEAYPEMPPQTLKGLLAWLTCRRAYLLQCRPGAIRFDLQRCPAGVVTSEQAAYAKKRFAERDDRAKDKWSDRQVAAA